MICLRETLCVTLIQGVRERRDRQEDGQRLALRDADEPLGRDGDDRRDQRTDLQRSSENVVAAELRLPQAVCEHGRVRGSRDGVLRRPEEPSQRNTEDRL